MQRDKKKQWKKHSSCTYEEEREGKEQNANEELNTGINESFVKQAAMKSPAMEARSVWM